MAKKTVKAANEDATSCRGENGSNQGFQSSPAITVELVTAEVVAGKNTMLVSF